VIFDLGAVCLWRTHSIFQRQGTLFNRSAQHLQRSQVDPMVGTSMTDSIRKSHLVICKMVEITR
jgi:hypothetical protein